MEDETYKSHEIFDFTEHAIEAIQGGPDFSGAADEAETPIDSREIKWLSEMPGCYHAYAELFAKRLLENQNLNNTQFRILTKKSTGANDASTKI